MYFKTHVFSFGTSKEHCLTDPPWIFQVGESLKLFTYLKDLRTVILRAMTISKLQAIVFYPIDIN